MITKPMLAGRLEDWRTIKYPVLATPKLDGIRCLVLNGHALSRTFKEIPNNYINEMVRQLPSGLDGEIILEGKTFSEVTSAVMSEDGKPDFRFYVFDYVTTDLKKPYYERMKDLIALEVPSFVRKLIPEQVESHSQLQDLEEEWLASGFEGVMIRTHDSPYKCGRSTEKEGYLLKIKRFTDSEGQIVGFEELLRNENIATKDELGHTKRSQKKENLVPAGTLGKLNVVDIKSGVEFGIGTGFDEAMRKKIWDNQASYRGKIVKYKYQEFGTKDKPRIPVFLGFRDERDM